VETTVKLGKHRVRPPAICAAVMAEGIDVMEARVNSAIEQGADVIELRLDGLRELEGWQGLLRDDVPMIVTNRAEREGGHFKGGERERIGPLVEAIELGAACVDIELSTPRQELEEVLRAAREGETSVLLSYHNFDGVPARGDLFERAKRMERVGCDIAKLACFAKRPEEAIEMLNFLVRARDALGVPVIAFAMGEAGKFTRILAPLLGSPLMYAEVGKATAPGQLSLVEMRRLMDALEGTERVEEIVDLAPEDRRLQKTLKAKSSKLTHDNR